MSGSRLFVFILVVLTAALFARFQVLRPEGVSSTSRFQDTAMARVPPRDELPPAPLPDSRSVYLDFANFECPGGCDRAAGDVTFEWNRILIRLCGEECRARVAQDPAACLRRTELSWAKAAAMLRRIDAARDDELAGVLAQARADYRIIEPPPSE